MLTETFSFIVFLFFFLFEGDSVLFWKRFEDRKVRVDIVFIGSEKITNYSPTVDDLTHRHRPPPPPPPPPPPHTQPITRSLQACAWRAKYFIL